MRDQTKQPTPERTTYQIVSGLKCYRRMGQLDKEFTCRMELCPYWSEDDKGTSICDIPQIVDDAIALLEQKQTDAQREAIPCPTLSAGPTF